MCTIHTILIILINIFSMAFILYLAFTKPYTLSDEALKFTAIFVHNT